MTCFYYALNLSFECYLLNFFYHYYTGEILKLNPSYKAPPDYRPLLKADKLLLPVRLVSDYLSSVLGDAIETRNILTSYFIYSFPY